MARSKKTSTRAGANRKSGRHSPPHPSRRTPSKGSPSRRGKRKTTPKAASTSRTRSASTGAGKAVGGQSAPARGGAGAGRGGRRTRGFGLPLKMTALTIFLIVIIVGVYVFLAARITSSVLKKEILSSGRLLTSVFSNDMLKISEAFEKTNVPQGAPEDPEIEALKKEKADLKERYSDAFLDLLKKQGILLGFAKYARVQRGNEYYIGAKSFGGSVSYSKVEITVEDMPDFMKVYEGTISSGGDAIPCYVFIARKNSGGVDILTTLAISRKRILDTQKKLTVRLVLFGMLFIIMGIMGSVLMANAITKPIIQLVSDMDIVARGNMHHRASVKSKDEIGLLARTFNAMTEGLMIAKQQERELQAYEAELDTAREIQTNLLPKRIINIQGYDLYCAYISAKDVGGDYYDFIPVDREHIGFVVADVAGKGVPGALVMSSMRTILRMNAVNNLSSMATLAATNEAVARDIKRGMFVTCLYAVLNVRTREMTVSSAGHNPMIIYRAAKQDYELVNPNGIALGFDKGPLFARTIREQKVKLEKGDRVVMYTDGVDECMSPRREEFGHQTLYDFVRDAGEIDSKTFVNALVEALADHQGNAEQHDDITISTFRVT